MRFDCEEERFTNDMLGSVAGHWRRMLENNHPESQWSNEQLSMSALRAATESRPVSLEDRWTYYGYPTLSMHLEIKKLLPSDGVQWLFLRARATAIENGRFNAEITILDDKLELVALSHQVSMAIKSTQRLNDIVAQPSNKI